MWLQPSTFDKIYKDLGWVSYFEISEVSEAKVSLVIHTTFAVKEGTDEFNLLKARHEEFGRQLKKDVSFILVNDASVSQNIMQHLIGGK